MSKKRVLITGMSGLIGQVCQRELGDSYALSALNRTSVAGVPCFQADIADLEAIRPAFEGVDVVVHLAAIAKGDATWEEVLPHNIVGTYNVFEAARIAGVKRIISASSGAAVSDSEREMPYRAHGGRALRRGYPLGEAGCVGGPPERPLWVQQVVG